MYIYVRKIGFSRGIITPTPPPHKSVPDLSCDSQTNKANSPADT